MQQLQAHVSGDGKDYSICFNAERLEEKKAKYAAKGATLTIHAAPTTLQPAAVGTATVTAWKQDLLPPKTATKTTRAKQVATVKQPLSRKTVDLAQLPPGGPATPIQGGPKPDKDNPNARPVVSITTGTYYPSSVEAARAINANPVTICQQLNGTGSELRKRVKGNTFRYATEAERTARKML